MKPCHKPQKVFPKEGGSGFVQCTSMESWVDEEKKKEKNMWLN